MKLVLVSFTLFLSYMCINTVSHCLRGVHVLREALVLICESQLTKDHHCRIELELEFSSMTKIQASLLKLECLISTYTPHIHSMMLCYALNEKHNEYA